MPVRAIFLATLLALFARRISPAPSAAVTPAESPGARVFAALAELDRAAQVPLWPGFDPREIPYEISDGGRTWLLRHPNPPAGFEPVPGRPDARVFDGRHDSARANTSVELGGVAIRASAPTARRSATLGWSIVFAGMVRGSL